MGFTLIELLVVIGIPATLQHAFVAAEEPRQD
jgi:prepilin-type N-terminal cleavage/methylation domain-containing protein